MAIKFGPGGLGPVKDAIGNLESFSKLGIKACEIEFTYGAYIKDKKDAEMIGKKAEELGIVLSIHAPYWINLNSEEREKVEKSKERILKSCEVGSWLGAKRVIFHPGYYGKISKEETYENIKREILELNAEIKSKKWEVVVCPETTGKINVFGSLDEIKKLVEETSCGFCIDFAHILAREKDYCFEKIKKLFGGYKQWHVHFSGIEYGEKGEKKHKKTSEEELKDLIKNLPKNKEIVVINESPFPVEDSVLAIKLNN